MHCITLHFHLHVCNANFYKMITFFTVKLEEMNKGEEYLMRQLNFSIQPDYKQLNKMEYKNLYRDYYTGLPENMIQQLQIMYKDDIALFGYPNSPFL